MTTFGRQSTDGSTAQDQARRATTTTAVQGRRYGKGKSEIYRAWLGDFKVGPRNNEVSYWQMLFVRAQPKPKIVAIYRIGPFLWKVGVVEWEHSSGEKIAMSKLGKPVEVVKLQAPTHGASRDDYNSDV